MKINKFVAEDVGIHIGDGAMWIQKAKNKTSSYVIKYVGDKNEDRRYYEYHIPALLYKAYRLKVSPKKINTDIGIIISSKSLVALKHEVFGLPLGKKAHTITIPPKFKGLERHVIRGIADTDGSLFFLRKKKDINYYPQIRIGLASLPLIKQIQGFLVKNNIRATVHKRVKDGKFIIYLLSICGRANLAKWMKLIGFNNPKHLTKYLVWKKYGSLKSYTTIAQRLKMLNLNSKNAGVLIAGIRNPKADQLCGRLQIRPKL